MMEQPYSAFHETKKGFWHHSRLPYRSVILLLICFLTFGSYYCYDIPGALKGKFFDHFQGLTQLQYNLLYSLYSWPNTVQVFLGGYIIDKYLGVRWGCFICCFILVVGQGMVSYGTQIHSLGVVLIGRFVFGLGGETLTVAQSAYTAKWFKGTELATAFGIVLSFSRLGSAVNFDISPAVMEMFNNSEIGGFTCSMYAGLVTCVVSHLCCMLLNWMDYHAEKSKVSEDRAMSVQSCDDDIFVQPDEVHLTDFKTFPLSVWIIFGVTITFYASVFVFLQNGVQYLQQRYGTTEKQAAFVMSMPYTVSALACPLFGYLVDKTGRAIIWILISTTSVSAIFFCFAFLDNFSPIIGVVGMGLCYSICASALWPCIAIIVDMNKLGMAYGLMTAFQNLGLAVFPLVIAPLLPDANRPNTTPAEFAEMYKDVMLLFGKLATASAALTILLLLADIKEGGWLNASAAALQERELKKAREEAREAHVIGYSTPAVYTHHVHHRNKYLATLGIRPHGGPRLFPEDFSQQVRARLPDYAADMHRHFPWDSDLSSHSYSSRNGRPYEPLDREEGQHLIPATRPTQSSPQPMVSI
mmetsp:Transcript_24419/g.55039  ORF Transcript_24419/g.55039 Transcript_24419/m.55039 type:complete len:583 (-) Transcript_24419:151-1899(-)